MSLVKRQKLDSNENVSLIKSKVLETTSNNLYEEAVVLEGHQGSVLSSKFSNDGSKIVTGGIDKTIQLWNLPTTVAGDEPNYGTLSGHKSAVTSAKWLYDDLTVVSASADTTVGFWDGETGQRIRKCVGHELTINEVDISKDSIALSVSDDGSARLWDQRQKTPSAKIITEFPLLTGTFNNHGSVIYLGGIDPTIKAYDMRVVDKPLWECSGQSDSITSIAINNDDSILVSRAMNGDIRTYSAKDHVPDGISRISPYVYDGAPSGNEMQLIRTTFSNNNVSIISGSEDKTVTQFDYNSRKILKKLAGHRGTVLDMDYHPTENIVLTSSTDGLVIVRHI